MSVSISAKVATSSKEIPWALQIWRIASISDARDFGISFAVDRVRNNKAGFDQFTAQFLDVAGVARKKTELEVAGSPRESSFAVGFCPKCDVEKPGDWRQRNDVVRREKRRLDGADIGHSSPPAFQGGYRLRAVGSAQGIETNADRLAITVSEPTFFHVEVEAELPAHAHHNVRRVLGTDQAVEVMAASLATMKKHGKQAALAWIVDVKLRCAGARS
jgi:hypothetical protein